MFALLIVRIEIGSETSEDVLHQIAVGASHCFVKGVGSRDRRKTMERDGDGPAAVFDKERD